MPYIIPTGSANSTASAGDINVNVDPYTEGVIKTKRAQVTGNKTFPAGAYSIRIIPQFAPNQTMNINGQPIEFGGEYNKEARENKARQVTDLLPAVAVTNAANKEWWYEVEYPSTNPIDIAQL